MKKALSILLVLLLAVSILPTAAFAEGSTVVLSPQNLRVNGAKIACEKYNIDGSNYFKLRDIAMVLSGTGSEFSVGWDGEKKVISVVTGESYEPNGSELDLSGGDKSATAAPSTQTLLINGVERGDLSAYNIGGNNFFKLRDLGDALGFQVDYDGETNTAIVVSKAWSMPTPWRIDESLYISNSGSSEHYINTFDEEGRTISSWYESDYYKERYDYFYDELGRRVGESYDHTDKPSDPETEPWVEHSYTTVYYDQWGLKVKTITVQNGSGYDGDQVTEENLTYDGNGNLIRQEIVSPYNHAIMEYEYDERGYMLKSVTSYSETETYIVDYIRDEEGRTLQMRGLNADGTVRYSYEYEYENGRIIREKYDSGDYHSVTTRTYDGQGNVLNLHTESTDWDSDTTYTYDEEGRQLTYDYYDGADMFSSRYTYDAEGRKLREEYSSPDDDYVIDYAYDAEGNPLSEVFTGSEYSRRTDYAYDPAEGRRTQTTVTTYPAATEMRIGEEELALAVGDEYYLYVTFLPYYAAEESVSWSSSDDSVVDVDGNGNVFARKAGSAVVTATGENGLTASCRVTVAEEKFVLTLEPPTLTIRVGETASVLCSLEIVGNWRSFKGFSFADYDSEVVLPGWADDWLASGRIYLYITGLEAGDTSISVYVRDGNNEKAGRTRYLKVTVIDDNSSAKPRGD